MFERLVAIFSLGMGGFLTYVATAILLQKDYYMLPAIAIVYFVAYKCFENAHFWWKNRNTKWDI